MAEQIYRIVWKQPEPDGAEKLMIVRDLERRRGCRYLSDGYVAMRIEDALSINPSEKFQLKRVKL